MRAEAGPPRGTGATILVVAAALAVAAALFLPALGLAPFVDPPEGFHAAVAHEMARGGDWITPHVNGVRYFDKPPLLYWLMAAAMSLGGPTPTGARLGSALPAVALAALTAWMGARWASPRAGLLAGLMVAANLELFLYARLVKPDLLFVLCVTAGLAALAEAVRGGGRGWLVAGYAALGLAALAKDLLGAVGPLAVIALYRWRGGPAPAGGFRPGLAAAIVAVVMLPWHLLVERGSPGFLWYTVVDNHLLNVARQRAFPDEDVPLGSLEFLAVTVVGFFPWVLAAPWALARGLRAGDREQAPWRICALWAAAVLVLFTLSPFKLPHYGLPAFPALALLTARLWDDALAGRPGRPRWGGLLLPPLLGLGLLALVSWLAWLGTLPLPAGALGAADVATRNLAAQGAASPFMSREQLEPTLLRLVLTFALGAAGIGLGWALRRPALSLVALAAAILAFLPVTAGGFALFAETRSVRPLSAAIARLAGPEDVLAHEGALENSASWLLTAGRPVRVVDGQRSNLAFGATFPEARDVFWDRAALRRAWTGPRRVLLLSAVPPPRSVTRDLPGGTVHVLASAGGRTLYSNRPGGPAPGR
jgi:4-amino-4-deoxy-L-arabinose transferase-like glycosyltransferase